LLPHRFVHHASLKLRRAAPSLRQAFALGAWLAQAKQLTSKPALLSLMHACCVAIGHCATLL
jgi:hypothetical protein